VKSEKYPGSLKYAQSAVSNMQLGLYSEHLIVLIDLNKIVYRLFKDLDNQYPEDG